MITQPLKFGLAVFLFSTFYFLFSYTAFANYGLRSVQRGIAGPQATIFLDVTINAVNPNKTIVFCSASLDDTAPGDGQIPSCELINATTLRIVMMTASASTPTYTSWQVVEFDGGVTVQRDNTLIGSTVASTTITIAPVDLAKAFIVLNNPFQTSSSTSEATTERSTFRARFTDASTVEFERMETGAAAGVVWQVVEMENATVQSGTVTIPKVDSGITAALSPAVDSDKTFLIYNYWADVGAGGNESVYLTSGSTTSNLVSFMREETTSNTVVGISWFAVEMANDTRVQQRQPAVPLSIFEKDVNFSAVNTANSSILFYQGCAFEAACLGLDESILIPFFVKSTTTGATTVRLRNDSAALTDSLKPTMYLIEWPKRYTRLRGRQIRIRGREIRLMQSDIPYDNTV